MSLLKPGSFLIPYEEFHWIFGGLQWIVMDFIVFSWISMDFGGCPWAFGRFQSVIADFNGLRQI